MGAAPGCVEARQAALTGFYQKWEQEPLVLLKWLALQVPCRRWCCWAPAVLNFCRCAADVALLC